MLNLAIYGADGRIGTSIISQLSGRQDLSLSYAIVEEISPNNGEDTGIDEISYTSQLPIKPDPACEVFIDFSVPAATQSCMAYCMKHNIPLVIGTTGHSPLQQDKIQKAAQQLAIMQTSNMSSAVNACFILIEQAIKMLGDEYDIEIIEKHHKHKIDAPSGTAIEMAQVAAKARGQKLEEVVVYDRSSTNQPRGQGHIGIQSIRGGEIVGEHDTMFINQNEIITISHKAYSKEIFAAGAIRAARWLVKQNPGLYSMADVLQVE